MVRQQAWLGLSLAILMTGCTSLPSTKRAPESAATVGECSVEFRSAAGNSKQKPVVLSAESTVQQVLVNSGAYAKYNRLDVQVVRKLPNGGMHAMPVEVDRGSRRVKPEFDYAVLPGDRVIVTEDPSTVLDDVIDAAAKSTGLPGLNAKSKSSPFGRR